MYRAAICVVVALMCNSVEAQVNCFRIDTFDCSDFESSTSDILCVNLACFDWDADPETPKSCFPEYAEDWHQDEVAIGTSVQGLSPISVGETGLTNLVSTGVVCFRSTRCLFACTDVCEPAAIATVVRTYYTYSGTPCP